MPAYIPTVQVLLRIWRPHKQRLEQLDGEHPTNIRFHRAGSWLQRVEQIDTNDDQDLALVGRWIAFNALYGQWDEAKGQAIPDSQCWPSFCDRILALDREGRIAEVLIEQRRPLVTYILKNEYLTRVLPRTAAPDTGLWYRERKWRKILNRLIKRIYFVRSQLVHGAATYNSLLTRLLVGRCSTMLGHLVPAILLVWIEHGADEDWGPMCYPPVRSAIGSRTK
jgi:hypothetical protein